MRDVTAALGCSRCAEAVALLREFASDDILINQLGDAWINAVAALDFPESRQLLLSFVDPEVSGLPAGLKFYRDDVQVARLADLARRDASIRQRLFQLCTIPLPPLKPSLLARVIANIGTTDALLAGLNLIDDSASDAVPYHIWEQIEATFVEHKALSPDSNAYRPTPRSANVVRSKLFNMAMNDRRRKMAASSLLAQIELWRLEYGRPMSEPHNPDPECKIAWWTASIVEENASAGG